MVRAMVLMPHSSFSEGTTDALMAIYHQLRIMTETSVRLRGAEDLSESLERLARRLPDR
jgi:hypothetical protein